MSTENVCGLVPNIGLGITIPMQCYTSTHTAIRKYVRMLMPNVGLSTTISNTSQIHPQHFGNFMSVFSDVCGAGA